ncbi:MAG: transposase [Labilithrix sp.]|nr:transposase [Labilithrix sp.]
MTVDASAVCSPGAETTDARLHVEMRVTDLDFITVRVEDVSVGETLKLFPWQPGQLAVGDRIYCNPPGIRAVVGRGADVLVRLNRGALPLCTPSGEPFDLMTWLRSLRGNTASETDVVVRDSKGKLDDVRGRVVAIRLPAVQAEKARARLARERGSKVSELEREIASYVVLFTTVPKSRLNANLCLELYRLRWQIELLFKRWKSLCGFDRLPNYLDDTITAWLYAKVLLALLMQRTSGIASKPANEDQVKSGQGDARQDRFSLALRLSG